VLRGAALIKNAIETGKSTGKLAEPEPLRSRESRDVSLWSFLTFTLFAREKPKPRLWQRKGLGGLAGYCLDCVSSACPALGEPVIVVDYMKPAGAPVPVALPSRVQHVDLVFVFDTTGGMGGSLAMLKSSFASLAGWFNAAVPSGYQPTPRAPSLFS